MANNVSTELDQLFDNLLGADKRLVYEQIGEKLPHTFRFNPLKGPVEAQQAFFRRQGFEFDPLEGREDIFQISYQPYPIGRSLTHFLGHIYVQDIASMIPALVLDPQPGEWVLDMSAAPGSKTTLMGILMQNRGLIVANDIVSKRLRALGKNVERIGLSNTLVYKWFGEQFGNAYFEIFDRVLLDPACSGIGTLHKNPEILTWWTPNHCIRMAEIQRNLLQSGIKALRPGGTLVYSTCTLTPEENEAVIQYALDNFPVELEAIELPWMRTWPGLTSFEDQQFHPDLARTIRLYPVDRLTEGFYVAKLRKTGAMRTPRQDKRKPPKRMPFLNHKTSPVKKYIDHLIRHFAIPEKIFKKYRYLMMKEHISFISKEVDDFPVYGAPVQIGLPMAKQMDHASKLNTNGCHLLGKHVKQMTLDLPDLPTLQQYVNREPLEIAVEERGQYLISYQNNILGYGVADKGQLKSQFPKGDWPFDVLNT